MSFDAWKKALIRLAKKDRLGFRVPNSDILYNRYFLAKQTPEQAWATIKLSIAQVDEGLRQAKNRQFSASPPDLDADAALLEEE